MPTNDDEWPHDFGFTVLPELPDAAPKRNERKGQQIGTGVMNLLGWQVVGRYPDVPKLIIAGGPHTSYWDGIIAFSTVVSLDLDVRVIAKKPLFRGPMGYVMNWLHAIPVRQDTPEGTVDQMVQEFGRRDQLVVGVAPEGTRSKVEHWRTGFYRIDEKSGVPILTIALDYKTRRVVVGPTIIPSGNVKADFQKMWSFMRKATPKNPAYACGPGVKP